MPQDVTLNVNGQDQTLSLELDTPLLYALRNDLELNGAKFGCGLGQCGACTVIVDGMAVRSCSLPVEAVVGAKITTLEGLGTPESPHPLQTAFITEQALQCGYCTSGMIMSAAALLQDNKNPTDDQIRDSLAGNLCRCGTHHRVMRAVRRAAGEMA